jgi:fido (protein-threonine AMPylation protein)
LPVPWNTDDPEDQQQIRRNAQQVLEKAVESAINRDIPTIALAQDWHRGFFDGCNLPVPYYAGEVRDTDPSFPELIDYEVAAGVHAGTPAREVPKELSHFEAQIQEAVAVLDARLAPGDVPSDAGILGSVLTLAASAHGEWVRIHPFANGNGRTGRVWANWSLVRYGLPAIVRLRPRPEGDAYAQAAFASMAGNHGPMVGVLNTMIRNRLSRPA